MKQFFDFNSNSPASLIQTIPAMDIVTLAQLETWITVPAKGGNGWGEVKPCLLIRVTAKDGVIGWGEAFILPCREKVVADIIHALASSARTLETVSPWAFRNLATQIAPKNRSMDFAAASSALEMALWDIWGKLAEKPLCELFGGDHNQAVRVYGNIWSDTQWDVGSLEKRATDLVTQGYRAVKIHPMLNHSVNEAAGCVTRVRDAIGDDIDLMVDLDSQDDPDTALHVAKLVAPECPYWFEEPVDGDDIQALVKIRKATGFKVVTGEKQSGLSHFQAVLAAGAADILNPDIAAIGGLLDILEVAGLADLHGVKVSPHCWNSMTVAAAAMLHVCASIPNAEMAEIYPEYIDHGSTFATTGFRLDGARAFLSGKPGLGVEIDVPALQSRSVNYHSTCLTMAKTAL